MRDGDLRIEVDSNWHRSTMSVAFCCPLIAFPYQLAMINPNDEISYPEF